MHSAVQSLVCRATLYSLLRSSSDARDLEKGFSDLAALFQDWKAFGMSRTASLSMFVSVAL